LVKSLEVVSTALKKMAGRPPSTLQDYFNKEIRGSNGEGTPSKRVKRDEEPFPPQPPRSAEKQKVVYTQSIRE
jgi:hypothetical protein